MPASAAVSIYNHQRAIPLSSSLLVELTEASNSAIPLVLAAAASPASPLFELDEIEVSLVDDTTIADVHIRFMNIPGATDVITFDHGEIHVSVETAEMQATDYDVDFHAEIMLYIVHGLLHLAGYEDASIEGRDKMSALQQKILNEVWPR